MDWMEVRVFCAAWTCHGSSTNAWACDLFPGEKAHVGYSSQQRMRCSNILPSSPLSNRGGPKPKANQKEFRLTLDRLSLHPPHQGRQQLAEVLKVKSFAMVASDSMTSDKPRERFTLRQWAHTHTHQHTTHNTQHTPNIRPPPKKKKNTWGFPAPVSAAVEVPLSGRFRTPSQAEPGGVGGQRGTTGPNVSRQRNPKGMPSKRNERRTSLGLLT